MTSLTLKINTYKAFAVSSFLKMLAYRLRYVTGIFTYLIFVTIQYYIWQAVFYNQPSGATINSFTLNELLTYVCIGWIARSFYFSNIDREINDQVISGQISIYLIKPINFQITMYAQAIGESAFRLLFFTIPISIVIFFIFPVELPHTVIDFLLFSIFILYSFLLLTSINFLIGISAFYLKSVRGLIFAKHHLVELLSGLIIPMTFFPESILHVLDYLPFKFIAYVPNQLYLGKLSLHQVNFLFFQVNCWVILLILFGNWAWMKARNKLSIQGG